MHVNTVRAALDKKGAEQGLHDTVDLERFRPVNVGLNSASATQLLEILAQCRDDADFGKGQRAQVEQDPASLLERCVDHLLEPLDLSPCFVDVPLDQSTADFRAEHQVGEDRKSTR